MVIPTWENYRFSDYMENVLNYREVLSSIYLKSPDTEKEWKSIANNFEELWSLPYVIRAIDGKQIAMECPKQPGLFCYNYKQFFSLVLLAICDANSCFMHIDIGQY